MVNKHEDIKLTDDRVMVKQVGERRSPGGIIIPDTVEKPYRGTVVRVGPEVPFKLKEGDMVLFGKYAGSEFTFHGEEVLVMRATDIVGIITNQPVEEGL